MQLNQLLQMIWVSSLNISDILDLGINLFNFYNSFISFICKYHSNLYRALFQIEIIFSFEPYNLKHLVNYQNQNHTQQHSPPTLALLGCFKSESEEGLSMTYCNGCHQGGCQHSNIEFVVPI